MRRILTLFLLAALHFGARAGVPAPGEFAYPVRGVSGRCAANFGEMRPGHFHAGIDIKTDGTEGKPLVAAADGYVSRVTVTAGGYGRALYLTLRNGTTAVYGHLQRFRDDLETHVDAERRKRRANSVDLHFGPDAWPVRRGDEIGRSGNSGASMGPHLHYELRDTPTQRRLNIVREGIVRPEDNLPPRIVRIHYVEIDTLDGVCVRSPLESYAVVRTAPGRYRLTRREPVETGRKGYFVAEVTDRRNGVHNTFGIWRATMLVDGDRRFEYRMDGFAPDLARCCDAVSCYPLQLHSRNEALRLAQAAGSPGCFYPVSEERGVVRTRAGQQRRIRLEVEDDSGNSSELEFDIRGRDGAFRAEADPAAIRIPPQDDAVLGFGREMTLHIPAGALYEAIFCKPERLEAPQADSGVVVLSPAYRILEATTPLRHAARATVRLRVPRRLQLRTALARITPRGRLAFVGGHYADEGVSVLTRATGPLLVVADTLPPRVTPLFRQDADLAGTPHLRFRAGDNFAGIAAWTLRIDGEWVPCDRFPMQGTLVHTFRGKPDRRRHEYLLTVTDACGNTARRKGTFIR